jgi:hypothetical protein
MSKAPDTSEVNAYGEKRNYRYFWKTYESRFPNHLSKANETLIKSGRAPEVDETWLRYHPDDKLWVGDRLVHHHVEHGNEAVAIPDLLHRFLHGYLHNWGDPRPITPF